jgi:hypothetical protein
MAVIMSKSDVICDISHSDITGIKINFYTGNIAVGNIADYIAL